MAAPYQTGLIVGRFLSVVADSADDTDQEPEVVPMSGTVTFTPQVSAVKVVEGADVPATVNVAPVSATLDSEGYLSRNGQRGIRLLATDGPTNPTGFTYQVSFALTLGGGAAVVKYTPFPVQVPSGRTVDLTVAAPVPSSSGVSMVQGVGVQDVTVENGEFVFRLTNGAESRTPAPTGGGAVTVESDGLGTYTINGSHVKGLTAEGTLPGTALAQVQDLTGGGTSTALGSALARERYQDVVSDDTPDAFYVGTDDQIPGAGYTKSYLSATSPAGRQNVALGRRDEGMAPLEFVFNGSELQVEFVAANWDGSTTQVWVDGRPLTDAPVRTPALTPGTTGFLHLRFPQARRRTIRLMNRGAAVVELRTGGLQDQILPSQGTPLVGLVADSFGGATDYATPFDTLTEWLSRSVNANVLLSSVGGSGYLSGGQLNQKYSDGARRYLLRTETLDAILFFGSINDDFQQSEEATRAAYRDTWTFYADANPTAPIIVYGVQPAGAETTVGMPIHRNNRLMYLEAAAHPNVVGFVDMLGTAKGDGGQPATWSATGSYTSASIVAYAGAIYRSTYELGDQFVNSATPNESMYWRRVSWVFTGTGNAGAPAGDGNRDVLLGADNTHPMPAAGYAFGSLMGGALVEVLSSPGGFTYVGG